MEDVKAEILEFLAFRHMQGIERVPSAEVARTFGMSGYELLHEMSQLEMDGLISVNVTGASINRPLGSPVCKVTSKGVYEMLKNFKKRNTVFMACLF